MLAFRLEAALSSCTPCVLIGLCVQLPWPLNHVSGGSSSNGENVTPRPLPTRKLQKPSPFASSRVTSFIAAGSSNNTPRAGSSSSLAAAAAEVSNGTVSPIPGLPERPERGCLSGPLATLQLVIHRVELMSQPARGWWLLLKVGPHWAKSTVRWVAG